MSRLDPSATIIRDPGELAWETAPGTPPRSVEMAVLAGDEQSEGHYLVLMRWYPGYMSAPHSYRTDRLCVVLSGVWWCNSGPDFDPHQAQPAIAGSFVHRVAHTPHHDGVLPNAAEPAVIAVTGVGPVDQTWIDRSQPWLRRV